MRFVGNKRNRGLRDKLKRLISRSRIIIVGTLGSLPLVIAPVASAAAPVVYNNIPSPTPGNFVSQAFEATQTSEFGGQIQLEGTQRSGLSLTVMLSSWGCESGNWYSHNCQTTQGTKFSEPFTANIYAVNTDNSPGALVASMTQTFNIPYRPSASSQCTGSQAGEWFSAADNKCYNGFATPITFNKSNVTWPDKVIVSVAYNTTHYGYAPYGETTTCFQTTGGCGYDSLNVGLTEPVDQNNPTAVAPSKGSDPQPNSVYTYSENSDNYCDAGATKVFRETGSCWTGYQPLFKVFVATKEPTNKDQCKDDGWKTLTDNNGNTFTNQGQCVSYANGRTDNGNNQSFTLKGLQF